MKESAYKNYAELPLFLNSKTVPILYNKDKTENPHKSKGFYLA